MSTEDNDANNRDISNNIPRIIRTIAQWLIAIIFSAVIVWKIANTPWVIDFSKFDFTALLSLILAIFSIVLSVLFYFKATDTSNQFYDNTYKFTKQISEILGRIEAGFGERLRHLDESYTGMRDKFDEGLDSSRTMINKTEEKIQTESKKLEDETQKKQEIIEKFTSDLSPERKKDFIDQLQAKDKQVIDLITELQNSKAELETYKKESFINQFSSRVVDICKLIIQDYMKDIMHSGSNDSEIKTFYEQEVDKKLPLKYRVSLRNDNLIDGIGKLTTLGLELLKRIAEFIPNE